ncbi:MAG: winged helix-turn-helix domain-containing protein [Eubacteriales bacterium]|nr:winged helix-turn-helix domain-containing protein [Eubacteriales bacterium]
MAEIILIKISDGGNKIFNEILEIVKRENLKLITYNNQENSFSNLNLIINSQQKEVFCEGKKTNLTSSEFKILNFFSGSPGQVFTKEQLYKAVFEEGNCVNVDNSIYCLIRSLRRKIEANPKQPKYIHTVRGLGYKFTMD